MGKEVKMEKSTAPKKPRKKAVVEDVVAEEVVAQENTLSPLYGVSKIFNEITITREDGTSENVKIGGVVGVFPIFATAELATEFMRQHELSPDSIFVVNPR